MKMNRKGGETMDKINTLKYRLSLKFAKYKHKTGDDSLIDLTARG